MAQSISKAQAMREAEISTIDYLNGTLADDINSLTESTTANTTAITQEAKDRQTADAALATSITEEESTRKQEVTRVEEIANTNKDSISALDERVKDYEARFGSIHIHYFSIGTFTPTPTAQTYTLHEQATSDFYTDRNVSKEVPTFLTFVILGKDHTAQEYDSITVRTHASVKAENDEKLKTHTFWTINIYYAWTGEELETYDDGIRIYGLAIYDTATEE